MKWKSTLFAATAFLMLTGGLTASARGELPEDRRLRILSFNIRNTMGMDGQRDLARTASVIRRQRPDVVAVQEVDSVTGRSDGRYVLGDLAAEVLMYPTYAAAIDYDGGKYGIGILSREKPLRHYKVALPGREERRALLIVEFRDYLMACTHLSLTPADQLASLPIIRAEAAKAQKPFFIAGDWNAKPDSETLSGIQQDFQILSDTKGGSYPADEPAECIDYIAVYKPTAERIARLSASTDRDGAASDHRAKAVTVKFKTPASRILYAAPYLQDLQPSSVDVMFQTRVVSHCWVEYGTDTLHLKRARTLLDGQEVCYDIENRIRLDSLEPGQRYYYRVCAQEIVNYQSYSKTFGETARTPFYSFRRPSASDMDFTAVIFNDLHENREVMAAFGKLLRGMKYDFAMFNGDCLTEPANREQAMHNIAEACRMVDAANHLTFFIRGNHEIRNAYSAGMHSLIGYQEGKTYGAFSWGDTRFVMLDCGEDKPDDHWVYYGLNDFTGLRREQVDFLRQELKSKAFKKADRRILINHIPIWNNSDKFAPCTELWAPLLKKASFDLNVCAHVHSYGFWTAGAEDNPCPVVRGGGPSMKKATMIVLEKRGDELTMRAVDTAGRTIERQIL